MKKTSGAVLLFATALVTPSLLRTGAAGPVPGAEISAGKPVAFPLPPSITALDLGNDQFQVTFRWKPDVAVESPGLAGTFNEWSRSATPMTGPDETGTYRATLRLSAGEYQYKFISGEQKWYPDPLNPQTAPGYGNSVLRLGADAALVAQGAGRGDGSIAKQALAHQPDHYRFYEVLSDRDVLIRYRTLRRDVEAVTVRVGDRAGQGSDSETPMAYAGSDGPYDFYEARIQAPATGSQAPGQSPVYRFTLRDSTTLFDDPATYPLTLQSSRRVVTPQWAANAIWYQIMIDRFRDGNPNNNPEYTKGTGRVEHTSKWTGDFYAVQSWEKDGAKGIFKTDGNKNATPDIYERLYGGDFQGVIDKLDYLKDLGVTALYFNPVFEATSAHKYNAKSYVHADDGYGVPAEFAKSVRQEDLLDPATWTWNQSDKEFLRLLNEAKSRGMRVILDGVFNHLGSDSIPMLDLQARGRKSGFADWYDVRSWEPLRVSGWAGFGGLPQFRKDPDQGLASKSLRDHIFAVTRRWMDPNGDGNPSDGIDGWRLDVPFEIPKPFWREWRRFVKSINPEAYLVGEVWDPAESWLEGTTFDAVMNYQFRLICLQYFGNRTKKIPASGFDAELAQLRLRYPRACTLVLQNLLDSHDTDRIASRLMNPDLEGDAYYDGRNRKQDSGPGYDDSRPSEPAYRRVALMAVFQATYLGAPMIYYGTEIGMYGADDPLCRMPMWWEDLSPRDNADYLILDTLREQYRALFALRKSHALLRTGEYRTLLADDKADVFAFARSARDEHEVIVVVLNNSDEERRVTLPAPLESADARMPSVETLFGPAQAASMGDGRTMVVLMPPISGGVFRVTE